MWPSRFRMRFLGCEDASANRLDSIRSNVAQVIENGYKNRLIVSIRVSPHAFSEIRSHSVVFVALLVIAAASDANTLTWRSHFQLLLFPAAAVLIPDRARAHTHESARAANGR